MLLVWTLLDVFHYFITLVSSDRITVLGIHLLLCYNTNTYQYKTVFSDYQKVYETNTEYSTHVVGCWL